MKKIVYIKLVSKFSDVINKENQRIPMFFLKIVYYYKKIFNIITKKEIEGYNIWVVPLINFNSNRKIEKTIEKLSKEDNIYVLPEELKNSQLLEEYNIKNLTGEYAKKRLVINILEYINNIQKKEFGNNNLTILVNNATKENIDIIEQLCKLVKSVKIVSLKIYKFKAFEERMYNEYGIALQFSNSYRKSLEKSKIIINFDFKPIDINEYMINNEAIIINCVDENLRIKSKAYMGVIVNSCNIILKKTLKEKLIRLNLYNKYNNLILYESLLLNNVIDGEAQISYLIGTNGKIEKNEFKDIKMLDKTYKTE